MNIYEGREVGGSSAASSVGVGREREIEKIIVLIIGSVGNADCDDHADTRLSSSSTVFAKQLLIPAGPKQAKRLDL